MNYNTTYPLGLGWFTGSNKLKNISKLTITEYNYQSKTKQSKQ